MKKVFCLIMTIIFVLSTVSVLSISAFAEDEEVPALSEEVNAEEELPEYPNLKAVQWGTLLLAAAKGIENLGKQIDEPGFDVNEYKLAYVNSLKKVMVENGYEEAWNIIQANLEKRMGKSFNEMNVANAADVVQYIFDIIEHDTGISVNDLPNKLRSVEAQKYLGPVLNALIGKIAEPVPVSGGSSKGGNSNGSGNQNGSQGTNGSSSSGSSNNGSFDPSISPNTGSDEMPDTGSSMTGVIVAISVLSASAAAAYVCSKKKKD